MMKLEPALFKTAVRSVKKTRSFRLDTGILRRLKKMFPDLLPDVYMRLMYDNEPDGKYRLLKQQILDDARHNWTTKLRDQGLIDAQIEDEQ